MAALRPTQRIMQKTAKIGTHQRIFNHSDDFSKDFQLQWYKGRQATVPAVNIKANNARMPRNRLNVIVRDRSGDVLAQRPTSDHYKDYILPPDFGLQNDTDDGGHGDAYQRSS